MQVRAFDPATDLRQVALLFGQLGYPMSEESLGRRAIVAQDAPNSLLLVVQAADAIVGVLAMHVVAPWHDLGNWAVVSALVVDEQQRGKGVGALLLSAAERLACANGCSHIELSSSESRVRAHEFYERAGFREVRKRFVKTLP